MPDKKKVVVFAEKYDTELSALMPGNKLYSDKELPSEVIKMRDEYNALYKSLLNSDDRGPIRSKMASLDAQFRQGNIEGKYDLHNKQFTNNAKNIQTFYKKQGVDVEIVPLAPNTPEVTEKTSSKDAYSLNEKHLLQNTNVFKEKVKGLKENDDVVILGHSGNRFLGIPSSDLAGAMRQSKSKNLYLGSCALSEERTGVFRKLSEETGKNVFYKPRDEKYKSSPGATTTDLNGNIIRTQKESSEGVPPTWYGFNKNAKSFQEGMYGVMDDKGTAAKELLPNRHYKNTNPKPTVESDVYIPKGAYVVNGSVPESFKNPLPVQFGREPIIYK